MLYTYMIFSYLHAKSGKDLKNAEMTTNKCVLESHSNKSCLKKLRKSWEKQ